MTRVWELTVGDATRVPDAARAATDAARSIGLDASRTAAAALTASELATNMHRYGGGGRFVVEIAYEPWGGARAVQMLAVDHGRGIADLPRARTDGFSSGDSLGTGLGACARAADFFEVHSRPGAGTVAVARFSSPGDRALFDRMAVTGGIHLPLGGYRDSGDALAFRSGSGHRTVMLADGLGHGDAAAEASSLAARFVRANGGEDPAVLMLGLHEALRRTRGAAVAVADIDESAHRITFCGVGNIGARLYAGGTWDSLLSRPGIVGAFAMRTPAPVKRAWRPGDMLVLYSDGLPTRWNPGGVEQLRGHDAALVAGTVFRDASSAARPLRDDTSVAVVTHTSPADGEGP